MSSSLLPTLLGLADRLEEAAAARIAFALAADRAVREEPPRTGLLMMTVTDPFDTRFHLGEVLVTEAAVVVGEARGWGMTVGEAPSRARLKAVLDALSQHPDAAELARAAELLVPEATRLERDRQRDEALVARTHVTFDLMPTGEVGP